MLRKKALLLIIGVVIGCALAERGNKMLSENCKKCTKVAHIYETHTAFEGMKLVDDMCSKCPDDPVKELEKRAGMEFGNCSGF